MGEIARFAGGEEFGVGSVLAGRYRIEQRVGAEDGGMGVVFVAYDERLRRKVAVKTIKDKVFALEDRERVVTRFENEVISAAGIKHPNVIEIFDYGYDNGILYYVMSYVPGSATLRARLDDALTTDTPVPLEEAYEYFLQATAGLRAIHDAGILHRDIKLENILYYITPEGPQLKILDFGVARLPESRVTRSGLFLGTPSYFSPEWVEKLRGGKTEIDERTDLFALGVTFYRLVIGSKPFPGDSSDEVIASIRDSKPGVPSWVRSDLNQAWDYVLLKLMEKDREARYPNAGALYEDLLSKDLLGSSRAEQSDVAAFVAEQAAPADLAKIESPPFACPDESVASEASQSASNGAVEGNSQVGSEPSAVSEPSQPRVSDEASQPKHSPGPVQRSDVAQQALRDAEAAAPEQKTRGPVREAAVQPPLDPVAVPFAKALKPRGTPWQQLQPRVRTALGLLGAVGVGLLIAVILSAVSRQDAVARTSSLGLDSEVVAPKEVTANELLRDQDSVRKQQLVGVGQSNVAPKAVESQPSQSTPALGATPARRLVARRKVNKPSPAAEQTIDEPVEEEKDVSQVVRFRSASKKKATEPAGTAISGRQRLGIPTGTAVEAQLSQSIVVGGRHGQVPTIAELAEPLSFPGFGEVLPEGTRFIGRASGRRQGERHRVTVRFSRMVLPDRSERPINATAMMSDGSLGLVAKVMESDQRAAANLGEGAVDVLEDLLSGRPGERIARRFSNDSRNDARDLRKRDVTLRVAENTTFTVQFMGPA